MPWVSIEYDEQGNMNARVVCHGETYDDQGNPARPGVNLDKAGQLLMEQDEIPAGFDFDRDYRKFRVDEANNRLIPCKYEVRETTTPMRNPEDNSIRKDRFGNTVFMKETVRVDDNVRLHVDLPAGKLRKNVNRKNLSDIR